MKWNIRDGKVVETISLKSEIDELWVNNLNLYRVFDVKFVKT